MESIGARLRARTQRFVIRSIKFARTLSRDSTTGRIVDQFVGAAAGISGNYHAACRARSRAEFIARLGVAVEEADESEHWLAIIVESGIASGTDVNWLRRESSELRAILFASLQTAKRNQTTRGK